VKPPALGSRAPVVAFCAAQCGLGFDLSRSTAIECTIERELRERGFDGCESASVSHEFDARDLLSVPGREGVAFASEIAAASRQGWIGKWIVLSDGQRQTVFAG